MQNIIKILFISSVSKWSGNHRALLGSFFQMMDNNFKLNGVTCRKYYIDWSKFSKSRIVFWKNYFDNDKFLKKIEF